ncbi:hypothetical protein GOV04_05040 [Candidatus Woesearchaeota archaeon]|nr:hypothetical protein [Candidatus Woesearchaeota archaeon]
MKKSNIVLLLVFFLLSVVLKIYNTEKLLLLTLAIGLSIDILGVWLLAQDKKTMRYFELAKQKIRRQLNGLKRGEKVGRIKTQDLSKRRLSHLLNLQNSQGLFLILLGFVIQLSVVVVKLFSI